MKALVLQAEALAAQAIDEHYGREASLAS